MAICVTGGAGYIGSHVVRQLSEKGEKVIVIDNLVSGFEEALIHGEKLYKVDVADTAQVTRILRENKVTAVMHFAASLLVGESVLKPLEYYANNIGGIISLLTACRDSGVQNFIFSSTAAVYGNLKEQRASEQSPLNPESPYGVSKAVCERILKDTSFAYAMPGSNDASEASGASRTRGEASAESAGSSKLNFVILRYFNVAGADPQLRMGSRSRSATHLIKVCCETALGLRDKVEVFGEDYKTPDGSGVRDYIHIEDLASAHLLALDYLKAGKPSTTLNVGYGQGSSVKEVIATTEKVLGRKLKVVVGKRREGDPASIVAQADEIRSTLGWKPQYNSLEKIISDALQWEAKFRA